MSTIETTPPIARDTSRLRDEKIPVRVTADEKATIQARADARGLSVSTYLRALGLGLLSER